MIDPIFSAREFEMLLPLAAAWAEEEEARILASGVPLSPHQLSDARKMGVLDLERVRVLAVAMIPAPADPVLQQACLLTGFLSPSTYGLSLRYGIYVREDGVGDRFLVAHELVHTAQYERYGSFAAFLRQYLHECLTVGYSSSPLEREAVEKAAWLQKQEG
jgi:hypothetical protein